MDTVELVMAFEEEFGLNIPDAAAERMTTPGDVVEWLVAAQERGEFFQPPPPPPKSRWALKHSNWPVPGQARPKLTRHQIAAGVRQRTMDVLGITPEQYRETGRFVQDFGAD